MSNGHMRRAERAVPKRLLTTKQVAERFGCSTKTVRSWCRAGHLKSIKIGNEYRISEEYLDRLIDGQPSQREPGRQIVQWPGDK